MRLPVRVLGVALIVSAYRPWVRVHGLGDALVLAALAGCAAWAAPAVDRRPTLDSSRRPYTLLRCRTTALACTAVLVAALGRPPLWQAACTTLLLAGYLAASDGFARPRGRVAGEALGACAGCLAVLAAAYADVAPSAWGRPVAALVIAGATAGAAVAVRQRSTERR